MRHRLLAIGNDAHSVDEIGSLLAASGFDAVQSCDLREGLRLALNDGFDAIVTDYILGGGGGPALVRQLREAGRQTPILMISALNDIADARATRHNNDYEVLITPFVPAELLAKLNLLLRARSRDAEQHIFHVKDLELDSVSRQVRRRGQNVELLPCEYKMLEYLMRNVGQLLSQRMIFEVVWDHYFDPGPGLIDVHVSRLCDKIDPDREAPLIRSRRGLGYMIEAA